MLEIDQRMWGNFAHHPDKRNETVAWSTVAGVARPSHMVILRGDESEVQRQMWRGPRASCYRVGGCKAIYESFGFSDFNPSGGG